MKRRRKTVDTAVSDTSLLIPYEKKRMAFGVLIIVFSFLIALSVISYSSYDGIYISDLKLSSLLTLTDKNSELSQSIAKTKNWLGLTGAIFSDFLINGIIGYFSIIIPLLLSFWGLTIVRNGDYRKTAFYTNLFLIAGILLAMLFSILGKSIPFFLERKEFYGSIGLFMGDLSVRILGSAGSIILIFSLLVLTSFLLFDYNLKSLIEAPIYWLREFLNRIKEKIKTKKNIDKSLSTPSRKLVLEDVSDETSQPITKINREKSTIFESHPILKKIDKLVEEDTLDETPSNKSISFKNLKENRLKDSEKTTGHSIDTREEVESWDEELEFIPPTLDLLDPPRQHGSVDDSELNANADLLRSKLALFDITIDDITVTPGPVVTLYEIVPSPGVKISRIVSLQDDIALALAAKGIRIIAPIPGKSAIGVEIPNTNPEVVYCRNIFGSNKFRETQFHLPLAFGKTTIGEIFIDDLSKMPHLLIAGATGSGKSVGINTIITSLLFKLHPSEIKFVIIDPKKIELSFYRDLKYHFLAACPDIEEDIITNSQNAVTVLKAVELEMERRYDMLVKAGVRNIQDYNEKFSAGKIKDSDGMKIYKLPYIIVVIDELADLMITAAREIEEPIARIAQLARAVGIHLILATQRPSVDVITGVIKANFNARIAYQVASKTDSRTILDANGAEKLLGNGDMLYLPSNSPKAQRIQNAFVSTSEVERIVTHISKQRGYSKPYLLPSVQEKKRNDNTGLLADRDELFKEAARLVMRHQQGSVSLLQRRLKIGYSRAARIMDELEEAGIVGPFDGSKARLVLIDSEEELDRILSSLD
jgi:S-DNA-T family DNA segregation ATPase FtsK/SpoIIIE